MKTRILTGAILFMFLPGFNAQCIYIPATTASSDTVEYSFSKGSFQSFGCEPIDPTFWIAGSGMWAMATYVNPMDSPTFRVWGMNDDDVASVDVNGYPYELNATSAYYDDKVVCGLSPGPDGIVFMNGNFMGANTNSDGNYSYQDIHLNATSVSSITIHGISGAGWGFAGVLVECPYIPDNLVSPEEVKWVQLSPNPTSSQLKVSLHPSLAGAQVEIMNMQGESISLLQVSGGRSTLDVRDLAPGLYCLKVRVGQKVVSTKRFVVVR